MKSTNIVILGHLGGRREFNDGQTVKTISIYNALNKYDAFKVSSIDTYYLKHNPFKFLFDFCYSLFCYKKYIVLLSDKGRKYFFPILFFMSICGKEIYHYAIGGRLAREVQSNKKWVRYISSFRYNWLESKELSRQLQELGIKNAVYLPNFKNIGILSKKNMNYTYSLPFRLCTFSRVVKEKGIEDAIEAVKEINFEAEEQLVTLDIYGPVSSEYLERFNSILSTTSDCRYCGVIPADESVRVLKDYYLLLFPTHWRHEGIPGTIIDSLSAGVPVIARNWQYCKEMITNGYNGYVYDFDKPEKLKDTIIYAINHKEETINMKSNCLEVAINYSEEHVLHQILNYMKLETE